jgi:hypothetical protein
MYMNIILNIFKYIDVYPSDMKIYVYKHYNIFMYIHVCIHKVIDPYWKVLIQYIHIYNIHICK